MNSPAQRVRSLILITADCLRADHAGFSGYTRPTTPFLDFLANEAIVFSAAIVAGAPTYHSLPAMFSSRYPLDLGRDIVGIAPGERTLATALQQAGYATAAFCAGNPYLTCRFGYNQGFDTFCDFLADGAETATEENGRHRPRLHTRLNRQLENWSHRAGFIGRLYDDLYFEYCQRLAIAKPKSLDGLRRFPAANILVDRAKAWLESVGERPFFLWLHFMDPHAPYYPVEEALRLMGDATTPSRAQYQNAYWNRGGVADKRFHRHRENIVALYDAGIRWVDAQVARLCEFLRRLRRWDDCVLAFSADHGEEFLDHGGRFHSPNKVTEELIRVPLLLRVPGQRHAQAGGPFGLVNLAPTALDIMGIDRPGEFRGRSYWPELRQGTSWEGLSITECVTGATNPFHRKRRLGPRLLAVRDERYKLVWDFATGRDSLFDLSSDPAELNALSQNAERGVRRRLMLCAKEHLNQSRERRDQQLRCHALVNELRMEWRTQHPVRAATAADQSAV